MRHLQGCYVTIESFINRLRVLQNKVSFQHVMRRRVSSTNAYSHACMYVPVSRDLTRLDTRYRRVQNITNSGAVQRTCTHTMRMPKAAINSYSYRPMVFYHWHDMIQHLHDMIQHLHDMIQRGQTHVACTRNIHTNALDVPHKIRTSARCSIDTASNQPILLHYSHVHSYP